jgi:hypothetical protein
MEQVGATVCLPASQPASQSVSCLTQLSTYLSSKKSLHRISQESGLSRSTCQRAAKNAKLHAYRISVVHELKEPDQVKRVAYCPWFQTLLKKNPGILDYTWFSDEAWFHLSG